MWKHFSDFWRQSSRHFEFFFYLSIIKYRIIKASHILNLSNLKVLFILFALKFTLWITEIRTRKRDTRAFRPNRTIHIQRQGSKAITWKKYIPNEIAPCQIPTYQLRMSWKEVLYTQVLAQPTTATATTRTTPISAETFLWFHTNSVCMRIRYAYKCVITLYLFFKKIFAKRCKHYIYNHYPYNWLITS